MSRDVSAVTGGLFRSCPLPHDEPITVLFGVPVTPVADLPNTCRFCDAPLVYAPDLVFVETHAQEAKP